MPAPANTPDPTPTRFLGCDVGKTSIVVFDTRDATTRTLPNQPAALAAFAATLDATCLVVCEATGGYEDALLSALVSASGSWPRPGPCPAHRADARKVKAFIRSFGTLAKSDALDARALAHYGQERHAGLARWQAPDPARERLQTLVLTRADLVAQRTACTNRLAAPGAEPVRACLEAVRACLATQIHALDAAIARLVRTADLAQAERVLRTIPGIGATTAAALLALMPELGRIDRRQAAALAGVAPHPNQSGTRDGYRRTRGGRPEVKRVLFLAALTASRCNPGLKAVYQRLCQAGKKPIVAITALMRRLVVIANARLRDESEPANQLS